MKQIVPFSNFPLQNDLWILLWRTDPPTKIANKRSKCYIYYQKFWTVRSQTLDGGQK